MIQNAQEKFYDMQWRKINLEVMKWCLEKYKETQDEFYYQQAKNFGEWSVKIKKNYLA